MSEALRRELIAVARAMNASGINQGKSGNLSVRLPPDGERALRVLITPSAVPYDELEPEDLVELSDEGTPVGRRPPSSEWSLHLAVLRARPELVTLDVGIALDDYERLRVERLLAQEGMAAEIRFTDVLKVVLVPTVADDGGVLLWTAVYEFDGSDYVLLGEPQLTKPGSGTAMLEMASKARGRFGFSLASLVAKRGE